MQKTEPRDNYWKNLFDLLLLQSVEIGLKYLDQTKHLSLRTQIPLLFSKANLVEIQSNSFECRHRIRVDDTDDTRLTILHRNTLAHRDISSLRQ